MNFELFMWYLYIVVKILVIVVLLGLVRIYIESYKKIKIGYTAGLLLFSVIFLVSAIFSLLFAIMMVYTQSSFINMPFNHGGVVEATIQLIAMSILYKITKDE